jgi:hypothetical protein
MCVFLCVTYERKLYSQIYDEKHILKRCLSTIVFTIHEVTYNPRLEKIKHFPAKLYGTEFCENHVRHGEK